MYFISTIQIKNNQIQDTRCVGYVSDLNLAKEIIKNNEYDLNETIYNYALIENIPEGIYQYDMSPLWFKFNELNEKYESCEIPECCKNNVGFGIG